MPNQIFIEKPSEEKVILRWLGHSAFKIKAGNVAVYIDPYEIEGAHEPADLILITHAHYDHCDRKSVDALKKPSTVIYGPDAVSHNIPGVKVIREGMRFTALGISVYVVAAYNPEKPYHPRGTGVGYVVTVGGAKIYHAGDTDIIPEMKSLAKEGIDVALLPIGGTMTMSETEASEVVALIKPKKVIPMHYGKVVKADTQKFKKMVDNDAEVVILEK